MLCMKNSKITNRYSIDIINFAFFLPPPHYTSVASGCVQPGLTQPNSKPFVLPQDKESFFSP